MGSEVPPSDASHPIPSISVGSTDDPRLQGNMVLTVGAAQGANALTFGERAVSVPE